MTSGSLADRQTRIPANLLAPLLQELQEASGRHDLGLVAGEYRACVGAANDAERAAANSATLREALDVLCRFAALWHEGIEANVVEHGEKATWSFESLLDSPLPPAMNELVMVQARSFLRRQVSRVVPVFETHFTHGVPTNMGQYTQWFGPKRRMQAAHNALVLPRKALDHPMRFHNPGLCAAFTHRAQQRLKDLEKSHPFSSRVRAVVESQMDGEEISMARVARGLRVSTSVLGRRLREEGTSHSRVVDEVRRKMARAYLSGSSHSIKEIAEILGFSTVTALYKAFRRWEGEITPAELRQQLQSAANA